VVALAYPPSSAIISTVTLVFALFQKSASAVSSISCSRRRNSRTLRDFLFCMLIVFSVPAKASHYANIHDPFAPRIDAS